MTADYRELVSIVQTWQLKKRTVFRKQAYQDGSNAKSLREFVEINNALSRRLISELQTQDPDFYDSLVELAVNASRILERRKTFINGQDVTQEGM